MTKTTIHLDTDGNRFTDEALYVDSYGDTWKYRSATDELLLVKLTYQKAPVTGPNVSDHYEAAQPLARDFGPLTRVPGGRPCAECPETALRGRAYCSTRCRNAADRHDGLDGDL